MGTGVTIIMTGIAGKGRGVQGLAGWAAPRSESGLRAARRAGAPGGALGAVWRHGAATLVVWVPL
jgi:hypothetical protein